MFRGEFYSNKKQQEIEECRMNFLGKKKEANPDFVFFLTVNVILCNYQSTFLQLQTHMRLSGVFASFYLWSSGKLHSQSVSLPLKQHGPGWFQTTGWKKVKKKCHQPSISCPRGHTDHVAVTNRKGIFTWCVDFNSRVWRHETHAVPERCSLRQSSIWGSETWPKSHQPFKVSLSEGNGWPRWEGWSRERWRGRG